jgi:molybdenum cofactor synthesis domain-containing protein
MKVEILAIGRELITGRTKDTNSPLMADRLFREGITVGRITLVDDSPDEIASAVAEAKGRGVTHLITTGGLGPTADDVTLEGVGRALGLPLEADERAIAQLKERYEKFFEMGIVSFPGLSRERMKMGVLPEGSTPIPNEVGAAPGVEVSLKGFTLYSIPGVPGEMEDIFEGYVFPEILKSWGGKRVIVKKIKSVFGDESVVGEIVSKVKEVFPPLYIKSKPEKFEKGLKIPVEFISFEGGEVGREAMERAIDLFRELEAKKREVKENG